MTTDSKRPHTKTPQGERAPEPAPQDVTAHLWPQSQLQESVTLDDERERRRRERMARMVVHATDQDGNVVFSTGDCSLLTPHKSLEENYADFTQLLEFVYPGFLTAKVDFSVMRKFQFKDGKRVYEDGLPD